VVAFPANLCIVVEKFSLLPSYIVKRNESRSSETSAGFYIITRRPFFLEGSIINCNCLVNLISDLVRRY